MKKLVTYVIIFILIVISAFLKKRYDTNILNNEIILGDTFINGDVNNDGKVSSLDYILIRKHIMKLYTMSSAEIKRADMNGDNTISSVDYILVRKAIMSGVTPTKTPTATPTSVPTSTPTSIPTKTPTSTPTAIPTQSQGKESKIHFIKTGDSDAILIESDGHYGLVDAARATDSVYKYLNSIGVNYLDFVIATHLHDDHIGGMKDIASKFVNSKTKFYYRDITSGYFDGENGNYALLQTVINKMQNNGASMNEVTNKTPKFTMGDFTIELMNTEVASSDEKRDGKIAGANKDAIVTYIDYKGKYGTLLASDMESQDEYRMVSKLSKKNVDVLKVGHHSWQSSTTMKFTKAIKPKIAIVTSKYLLDDISTPVYYMQQVYGTKFYLTEHSNDAIIVSYGDSLNITPTKAKVSDYRIVATDGKWKKLQNNMWFYQDGSDLSTIKYDTFITDSGKKYYVGLQGNMMIGWIEVSYEGSPGLFYMGTDGVMVTGWAQPIERSTYNNSIANKYYETGFYSHVNDTIDAWYTYNTSTWANGKNWFYFDPTTGRMLKNGCFNLKASSTATTTENFCFNKNGICYKGTGCSDSSSSSSSSSSSNNSSGNSSTTKNGWIEENGSWYYYVNGTKATNKWCPDGSDWYYAGSDGKMVKNKWISYDSKWYYFGSDAKMVKNTTMTIDGTSYSFNADGVCTSQGC